MKGTKRTMSTKRKTKSGNTKVNGAKKKTNAAQNRTEETSGSYQEPETVASKRIYKDFKDWWQHGKHGWSSASRDMAEATWADFEPTIMATRDDYTALMLREVGEMHKRYVEHLRDVHSYVEEHNLEAVVGINLYRWLLEKRMERTSHPEPRIYSYKGNEYAIVGEVKMKHPVTGVWVAAYHYVNREEPKATYVREKSDFDEKFVKVEQVEPAAAGKPK